MDNIHIIVRGICLKGKSILLAFHKDEEYFFLPGGHVEYGESMTEALKRELKEELDSDAVPGKLIYIFEHSWMNKKALQHEINFLFYMRIQKRQKIESREKHLEFRWVPMDDLGKVRFLPAELKKTIRRTLIPMNKQQISFSTSLVAKTNN